MRPLGWVYGRVPWNEHRMTSSASSSATSTRTIRSRWRCATRCITSPTAGSSASFRVSTSRPARTGTDRSRRSSRAVISSCCSSRRRRRTGTGASTRRGCSRVRRGGRLGDRVPLQSGIRVATSACQPAGCPSGTGRRRAVHRRAVSRDVVHLGRLAAGRTRRRRRRGPDRGRGRRHCRGIPDAVVCSPFALRMSPRRARPSGSRVDRLDHSRDGSRRRGRRRNIGTHALAVQPRRRSEDADVARPARRCRRDRRVLAASARSAVRRRAQRGAVHADVGEAGRMEPRTAPSASLQTRALPNRAGAGG